MTKNVLISVFNKTNIKFLAQAFVDAGYNIIATEGTGKKLNEAGIEFIPAQEITGNPAALQDCIQTISYNISGGILFNRGNKHHIQEIEELDIKNIDAVVCNFPPLEESVKSMDTFDIQHVDVGGPLMVRAAATNYSQVLVVTDTNDYEEVAQRLRANNLDLQFKKNFAVKAFSYCMHYDKKIVTFLKSH